MKCTTSRSCWVAALVCASASVGAQGIVATPLADDELSGVWGQALLNLTNTTVNDLDFTRITLAADIRLNANLGNIRLGEYTYSVNNGTGADIDISSLNFGGAGSVASKSTVSITDPYIEFVYRNVANSSTREVVGMRLGFGSISGNIGVQFNSLSGSMQIATSNGTLDLTGKRLDATTCASGATCPYTLAQIAGITAGDASSGSRDFFLSVLKSNVTFPTNAAGITSPEAMAGFWLNWRDKLVANSTR